MPFKGKKDMRTVVTLNLLFATLEIFFNYCYEKTSKKFNFCKIPLLIYVEGPVVGNIGCYKFLGLFAGI